MLGGAARAEIGECGGLSGASERDRRACSVGVNNKHTRSVANFEPDRGLCGRRFACDVMVQRAPCRSTSLFGKRYHDAAHDDAPNLMNFKVARRARPPHEGVGKPRVYALAHTRPREARRAQLDFRHMVCAEC